MKEGNERLTNVEPITINMLTAVFKIEKANNCQRQGEEQEVDVHFLLRAKINRWIVSVIQYSET